MGHRPACHDRRIAMGVMYIYPSVDGNAYGAYPNGDYVPPSGDVYPHTYTYTHYASVTGTASYGLATVPGNPCSLRDAMLYAQAGDVIHVEAGDYLGSTAWVTDSTWGSVWEPANSGTAESPIIFVAENPAAYNYATPALCSRLRHEFTTEWTTDGRSTVGCANKDHIIFDGFYIDENDCAIRREKAPCVFNHATGCEFRRLYAYGDTLPTATVDNHSLVRIENCENIKVTDSVLTNAYLQGNPGDDHAGAVIIYGSKNTEIAYNDIHDCHNGIIYKGDPNGGFLLRNPHGCHHNKIHNMRGFGWSTGTSRPDLGTNYADIYQNLFYDYDRFYIQIWGTPADATSHYRLVNNTFANGGDSSDQCAFYFSGDTPTINTNAVIANNVLTQVRGNNIYTSYSQGNAQLERITSQYNLLNGRGGANVMWNASGSYTLAQWQARGNETGSIEGDPLFIDSANDDYRLNASSPGLGMCPDYLGIGPGGNINAGAHISENEVFGPRSV